MGSTAEDVLSRAVAGKVLSVFCQDVGGARLELRAAAEESEPMPTLVALEWSRAPALASELDEIRDALARAAKSLWPDWFMTAEHRFERQRSTSAPVAEVLEETAREVSRPSSSWLKEAWRRCREGELPLVPRLTTAEQVRQLSRALDPQRLFFALSVASAEASPARVRALSRAAEWLSHESEAKTVLLLPEAWQRHPELDHVTYQALSLAPDLPRPAPSSWPPPSGSTLEKVSSGEASSGEEAAQVVVGPIVGKPHPASEMEQLLSAHLSADPELAPLFDYNRLLTAYGDKRCRVDLVWQKGALVIEVDGDEHRSPLAYQRDRDRDYRLFMSGYTTLRVTNAEVSVDVEAVVAKIRGVVRRLRELRATR